CVRDDNGVIIDYW
nr:immunoglobulin heavy chain junction region [Macaca mulatta]